MPFQLCVLPQFYYRYFSSLLSKILLRLAGWNSYPDVLQSGYFNSLLFLLHYTIFLFVGISVQNIFRR